MNRCRFLSVLALCSIALLSPFQIRSNKSFYDTSDGAKKIDDAILQAYFFAVLEKRSATQEGFLQDSQIKTLDGSIPFKEKGNQLYERWLGIEDDYFVIFDEHRPGEFHGHISSWERLTQEIKNALSKSGLTRK